MPGRYIRHYAACICVYQNSELLSLSGFSNQNTTFGVNVHCSATQCELHSNNPDRGGSRLGSGWVPNVGASEIQIYKPAPRVFHQYSTKSFLASINFIIIIEQYFYTFLSSRGTVTCIAEDDNGQLYLLTSQHLVMQQWKHKKDDNHVRPQDVDIYSIFYLNLIMMKLN